MSETKYTIVTVTPTIQDGVVVRWFASEYALEMYEESLSVSRNRVSVHRVDIVTQDDWSAFQSALLAAQDAFMALAHGRDVAHLATYQHSGFSGPWERIGA